MVATLHAANGTFTPRSLRQIIGALIHGTKATRPLGARSGVAYGTPTTTVTATSTTWTVQPHTGVIDAQTAAEAGPYMYAIDAAATGAVTAAHATYARKDIVWVRVDDNAEDGSGSTQVVAGYTAGTASASPAVPTPPASPVTRYLILAVINVPASGGGSPTVTWQAPYAVAAGGIIPVRTTTERDAITWASAEAPVYVDVAANGILYRSVGSGWVPVAGASVTMPHARFKANTTSAHGGSGWSKMYADAAVDTSAVQPWTLNSALRVITLTADGVYRLDAVVSMSSATFTVRIAVNGAKIIAQSASGSSPSQTNSTSTTRRLTSGDVISYEAFPTVSLSNSIDSDSTPCYLSLTRLSD